VPTYTSIIDAENDCYLLILFSVPVNTFVHLVTNFKNKNADAPVMTTFGERVKNAWKNIYPVQESDGEKKKKRK
jgi:hypothetical protein